MIKHQLFRVLLIPLMGAAFPFLAGLFMLQGYRLAESIFTFLFFTTVAFAGWQAVATLTAWLRTQPWLQKRLSVKIVSLPLAGALCSAALYVAAVYAWQALVQPQPGLWQVAVISGATGGALLSLLYEVAFLSIEKEQDVKVLQQIDRERREAEAIVLKNELDPHFFFNCMNTLSYLVRNDADKAWQFVHKLSNVYKYFLRNKEKEYVSLPEEMEFLDNYLFLLRIRFDDNIRVDKTLHDDNVDVSILPCTLQVLVENAIKHNFFSEKEPLVVSIELNGHYITVSNTVRPKPHASDSTKVGLRNLKARYRLHTNQHILVQKTSNKFLVKLPIVKTTKP